MDAHELISSFAEFAKQKNIDRPTMIRILEDVFRNMIKKKYGVDDNGKAVPTDNFDIIINADKGDLEIWRFREIVDDDSEDIWEHDKIALSDAKKIEPDFEVGEEVSEQVYIRWHNLIMFIFISNLNMIQQVLLSVMKQMQTGIRLLITEELILQKVFIRF